MKENSQVLRKASSRKLRDEHFEFSGSEDFKPLEDHHLNHTHSAPVGHSNDINEQLSPKDPLQVDVARLLDINSLMSSTIQNLIGIRSPRQQSPIYEEYEQAAPAPPLPHNLLFANSKPPSNASAPPFPKSPLKTNQPIVEQNRSKRKAQQSFLSQALQSQMHASEITRLTKQTIGSKVYRMTDQFYWQYSKKLLSYQDMKIKFSWSIMDESFQLFATLNQHHTNSDISLIQFTKQKKFEVARMVDRQIRDILEYMLNKYQPSRKKIIDTDLISKVKEVKRHTDLAYDILLNARFDFGYEAGKADYSRDIKRWLNVLVIESKAQLPRFRKVFKHIFTNKEFSDGGSNLSISGLDFSIGSLIHQSTATYTDQEINSPGLKLKRPEILKILMRWLSELLTFYQNTEDTIVENKVGFKSISKGMFVNLTKKRKEVLAQTLKKIYKEDIISVTAKRTEVLDCLIMDLFNLTSKGFHGYDSFAQKDVILSKISQYLSECIQSQVLKLLSLLIHSLNSVRQHFDPEVIQSSLNLVTFSIMDLLKARCVSSKQQIMKIYNSLKQHADYIQIIRVRNRLNESTRDLIINFKLKQSFLIGQLQLGLGEQQQQVSQHFSNFLTQLAHSRFPVLMQCSNQIVNQDPKLTYFTKSRQVQFFGDQQQCIDCVQVKHGRLFCSKNHPQCAMEYFQNDNPFCCNQCNRFIEAFTFYLEYVRCHECLNVLCPPCLVGNRPEFEEDYLERYINSSFLYSFFEREPYFRGFGDTKAFMDKALQAAKKYKYIMTCQIDNQSLKINIRKLHKNRLVYAFQCSPQIQKQKVTCSPQNWNFILIPKNITTRSVKDLLYIQKMHYKYHWHEFDEWITEQNIEKLIVVELQEDKKVMILDFEGDTENIDEFVERREIMAVVEREVGKQEINLDLTSRGLTRLFALEVIKNKEAVKILNLWENRIEYVTPLKVLTHMQQLYMRDNLVTSIQPLLGLTHLQILNIQHNKLTGQLPALNFPLMKALDLSNNHLSNITSLSKSNLQHLVNLFISSNQITQLPNLSNLPELEIINFQSNRIESLEEFAKSQMNNLRRLNGCSNRIGRLPKMRFLRLEIVYFYGNWLEGIQGFGESELPNLQILKIQNNRIAGKLPVLRFPRMHIAEIGNNQITDFSSLQKWETPLLKQLQLQNNKIEGSIPILPFNKLKKLSLQINKIRQFGCLHQKKMNKTSLQQLQFLNLSHNQFTGNLPQIYLKSLTNLNLSYNKFSSLDNLIKMKLPSLQTLDLSYNDFSCPVPILFFERLVTLKLDGNDIKALEFITQRQLVPKLKNVTAEGNRTNIAWALDKFYNMQERDVSLALVTPTSEGNASFTDFNQFTGLDSA